MSETPASPRPSEPPRTPRNGTDPFFDSVRRTGLVRTDHRWVGGVAGGVARRFGFDPLLVRGLFAVSVLVGGLGLLAYGVGWLLMPEESDGRIHAQQLVRGDVNVAVLGAVVAIIAGVSAPTTWWPDSHGWWRGTMGFGTTVLVVVVIVLAVRNRGARAPQAPPAPWAPSAPFPPAPGTAAPPAPSGVQDTPVSAGPAPTTPTSTAPISTARTSAASMPAAGSVTGAPPTDAMASTTSGGSMSTTGTPYPASTPAGYPQHQAPYASGPGAYGQYGQPYAAGPAYYAPQPAPVAQPLTATRRPGAGGTVFGVIVALTLLTLAGLLLADRAGVYEGSVAATTAAVALGLLGLGIVVTGLRGRRAGGLTTLAIIGFFVAAPMAATANEGVWDGTWNVFDGDTAVGDVSRTPTTVTEAEDGLRLGAGNGQLDLTAVPLDGDTVVVPVRLGAGDLTVVLPEGVSAEAVVNLTAGQMTWVDGQTESGAGNGTRTYQTDKARDGDPVELRLDIRIVAGQVTVQEG